MMETDDTQQPGSSTPRDGTSARLSTNTRKKLLTIIESLEKGEASLTKDNMGRPVVTYEKRGEGKQLPSVAPLHIEIPSLSRICDGDDQDRLLCPVRALRCYLATSKSRTKIQLQEAKNREEKVFEITGEILGLGNTAGDIVVVRNIITGEKMARKTIKIAEFREEEILAWVDLEETGYPPDWYLFRLEDNRVVIYMEIISEGITLREIIDKYWSRMDISLRKAFSLYVFGALLAAIHKMSVRKWVHSDLHAGNVMIQKQSESKIKMRTLDFGQAQRFDPKQGSRHFPADIAQAIRLFSVLYSGDEFNDRSDLNMTFLSKDRIKSRFDQTDLKDEEKKELIDLIVAALMITDPVDIPNVQDKVKQSLGANSCDEMMNQAIELFFPNVRDLHPERVDYSKKDAQLHIAEFPVSLSAHSTSAELADVAQTNQPESSVHHEHLLSEIRKCISVRPAD